jgi:hypothetical protein
MLMIVILGSSPVFAQERGPCAAPEDPKQLKHPPKMNRFVCQRTFLYRGEFQNVDTPESRDGGGLLKVVRSVPEAEAEILDYQRRRRNAGISAYTGTAGLGLFFLAGFLAGKISPSNQDALSPKLKLAGAAIALGGFAYSFTLIRTNESRIERAADAYNKANPNDLIELQVQASWTF